MEQRNMAITVIERIVDLETGETTDVERPETKEETASREAAQIEIAAAEAARIEKEAARAAVLDKLGLSTEEVTALLG